MTCKEALQRFGLPASPVDRDEIRRLLGEEIERAQRDESGEETLRTLCVQLFSLGVVEDSLLIWDAKEVDFDSHFSVDIQFLCGAGLQATKDFLAASTAPTAPEALGYLNDCEKAGNFANFSLAASVSENRRYYGLDANSNEPNRNAHPALNPAERDQSEARPKKVFGVAWLLIVLGSFYIVGMVFSLFQHGGGLRGDALVFLLPFAGVGLLKRSAGWRGFLLCLCWLGFIIIPNLIAMAFVSPQSVNVDFGTYHATLADAPFLGALTLIFAAAFFAYIYYALTRPDVLRWLSGR